MANSVFYCAVAWLYTSFLISKVAKGGGGFPSPPLFYWVDRLFIFGFLFLLAAENDCEHCRQTAKHQYKQSGHIRVVAGLRRIGSEGICSQPYAYGVCFGAGVGDSASFASRAVGDSEVAGGDIAVGGDLQQSSVDTATDVKTRQIEEQIIVDGQRCIGHGHIPQQGELDIGYGWSKVVWIGYRGL